MDFGKYSSQVQEWIRNALENRGINAKKTIASCENILEYAQKSCDEGLLGFSYYYIGEAYYILNNVDKLFKNVSKSLTYLDQSGQWELLARGYNILAITSVGRGNAPFAMDYYLNALSYCNKYHMDDIGIMVNMNIGALYNWLGEYSQAQRYYEVGYQILQENRNIPDYYSYLLIFLNGMGNTFLCREMPKKAIGYEERAITECIGKVGLAEELSFYCFQASLQNSLGFTEKRERSINKIKELMEQPIEILSVFDDLYMYCEMLFQIRKYDDFIKLLDRLEQMAASAKIVHIQKKLLDLRIKYYKIEEDWENYQKSSAKYYELSELMEKENRYTIMSMINIRNFLEESTRQRKAVEQQNKILQQRSETDPLTGMYNRYRLNNYAEDAFVKAIAENEMLAVEILDIDYFKQYNDNYGHQAGDLCIKQIANTIQTLAKECNIFCARYGGDEFIIIYENLSKEEVTSFSKRLKQSIMNLNIEHRFSKVIPVVTISQGICYDRPQDERKIWDFLHTADSMLYKVKQQHRNGVCIGSLLEEANILIK